MRVAAIRRWKRVVQRLWFFSAARLIRRLALSRGSLCFIQVGPRKCGLVLKADGSIRLNDTRTAKTVMLTAFTKRRHKERGFSILEMMFDTINFWLAWWRLRS